MHYTLAWTSELENIINLTCLIIRKNNTIPIHILIALEILMGFSHLIYKNKIRIGGINNTTS